MDKREHAGAVRRSSSALGSCRASRLRPRWDAGERRDILAVRRRPVRRPAPGIQDTTVGVDLYDPTVVPELVGIQPMCAILATAILDIDTGSTLVYSALGN